MTTLTPTEHQALRSALADALVPHQAALGSWIGALAHLGFVDLADTPLSKQEADLHFFHVHGAFRSVNLTGREVMRRADRLLDSLRPAQRTDELSAGSAGIRLLNDVTSDLASHSEQDAAIRALGYWTWDQVIAYVRQQLLDFADHCARVTGERTPLSGLHLREQAVQFANSLEVDGPANAARYRDSLPPDK